VLTQSVPHTLIPHRTDYFEQVEQTSQHRIKTSIPQLPIKNMSSCLFPTLLKIFQTLLQLREQGLQPALMPELSHFFLQKKTQRVCPVSSLSKKNIHFFF
jgi:hypothetical protein